MRERSFLVAGLLALCSCGGGDGGANPPPTNRAPVITSAAAASVAENSVGTAYQATATDADGDPITFTIEGTDAARFAITAAGALSFRSPPDFEHPVDAGVNNVYDVRIVASDGKTSFARDIALTVTNVPDLVLRFISNNLVTVNAIAALPGTTDVLVAEESGNIYRVVTTAFVANTPYLTVSDLRQTGAPDTGLINIVVAPDYTTSGYVYAFVRSMSGDIEIRRYGRAPAGVGDPGSASLVLRIPATNDRVGGALAFGPDGMLYVGIGAGGPAIDPLAEAQNLASLYGKILRIDVRGDDFPADANRNYAIPGDNPFVGTTGADEIFAYGFDTPRRMSFDGANLLVGDAGDGFVFSDLVQEVNLIRPQDRGGNYGAGAANGVAAIPPVIRYPVRRFTTNAAITAGYVYRGPVAQFSGLYFFADAYPVGAFTVPAANIVQGTTIERSAFTSQNEFFFPGRTGNAPADPYPGVPTFGVDANNNLLISILSDVYIIDYR